MSWRKGIAFCIALLASACGFEPVYGTHGGIGSIEAAKAFSAIDIIAASDRQGQILTNDLIDRMHPEGKSPEILYNLNFNVIAVERDLGIEQSAVASRSEYQIEVPFTITDKKSGVVVFKGDSRTVVSYDILNDQYATLAADEDALNRGLENTADDMVTRLALFFRRACAAKTITCPGQPLVARPQAAVGTLTEMNKSSGEYPLSAAGDHPQSLP